MTTFFSSAPQLKRDPLGGKRGNMEDLLRTIRRTITIGVLGLAGCNWFGSGVQVDTATTSVTRPRPDSMVSVSYRVTNRGSTSTYLLACDHRPDAETDRLVASGWQEYLGTGVPRHLRHEPADPRAGSGGGCYLELGCRRRVPTACLPWRWS